MRRRKDWDLADKRLILVWEGLETWIRVHEYPPTVRELAGAVGLNRTVVNDLLMRLAELGAVERRKGVARGIKLVKHRLQQESAPAPEKRPLKRLPVDEDEWGAALRTIERGQKQGR